MTKIRAAWCLLAFAAVVFALWQAFEPIESVDLGCAKGSLFAGDGSQTHSCDDPIWAVEGVFPLLELGVVLAIPPTVAALAMRVWVSFMAVAALVALAAVGLGHWAGFWILLLLGGVPMAIAALFIAFAHLGVRARSDAAHSVTELGQA